MTADSKQKLRLWLRLLRTSRRVEAELRRRLRAQFDVTLPRFDVMAALARLPAGMTMTELSRQLVVSNGNVTGIIDGLVADDIVVRMPAPDDRRTIIVRLTPAGARRFQAMAAAHEGWVDELFAGLSVEDCAQAIGLLAQMRQGGQPAPAQHGAAT